MVSLRAFVRLSRFKFLAGGILAGGLGTAIAAYERGGADLVAYAIAQLAVTATHQMTHYANEYFDMESDALASRTAYSGGSGVLVEGLLKPWVAIVAAASCALVAVAAIAALDFERHTLAAGIAVVVLILAWAYSAPPVRLLARGLGELDTALVVGTLVPLCAYAAQTGIVDLRAVASTLPAAIAMFAMMLAVEFPDLVADAATGKRNIVVRSGLARTGLAGLLTLGLIPVAVAVAVFAGAPLTFGIVACIAIVPGSVLAASFGKLRLGETPSPGALAFRGVATFFTVAVCGVLGYALALHRL